MNRGRNAVGTGLILCTVLAFVFGISKILQSSKDLALAPKESTASATVMVNHTTNLGHSSSSWMGPRCSYWFRAGDAQYTGLGSCPSAVLLSAVATLNLTAQQATVYFDPTDPSTNSLIEFKEKSDIDHRTAVISFAAGAVCVVLIVMGLMLNATQNAADAQTAQAAPEEKQTSQADFMNSLDQILDKERREGLPPD